MLRANEHYLLLSQTTKIEMQHTMSIMAGRNLISEFLTLGIAIVNGGFSAVYGIHLLNFLLLDTLPWHND